MNSKIFIVTHKFKKKLDNEVYSYIYVSDKGCAPENSLRDDIGDNIADKNDKYNELTAIYWVYKHLDQYKNLDYIGFEQFRRMFAFKGTNKTCYVKSKIKESLINITNEEINNYFTKNDLIAPFPSNVKSVYKHYTKAHNDVDLMKLLEIIKNKFPKYKASFEEYLNSNKSYLYNAFIFKKSTFIEYCKFIFPVIDEYLKTDIKLPERFYFTERLTGAFIYHLLKNNKNVLHIPILIIKERNFKFSFKKTVYLLKDKSNSSFLFKVKPLILYFMPNCIEQKIRRKIYKKNKKI